MITQQAQNLHREVRRLFQEKAPLIDQQFMSQKLFNELFDSCDPTLEEFAAITYSSILSGSELYCLTHGGFRQARWYRRLLRFARGEK